MASNLYGTLADYKAYSTARGQLSTSDISDDGVIVDLLEQASRYFDEKSGRQAYPTIETRLYDVPSDSTLWLDGDLLSVITLTNGDTTVITTANYVTRPNNFTPYYAIEL